MIDNTQRSRNVLDLLQKKETGILMLCCFLFATLVLLLSGAAGQLHTIFPALAVVTGLVLLWCWPTGYVTFTFWLWILTPFIRRLIDYRSAFVDPSPILVAPLIVTGLAGLTVLTKLNRKWSQDVLPHSLVLAAICLGFCSGFFLNRKVEVVEGFIAYAVPVFWSIYILLSKPGPQAMSEIIRRNFMWAVLFMGAYGIVQYLTPPEWDRIWLENVIKFSDSTSFGRPDDMEVRVWSTLNGPGIFGSAMMCGLLLLLGKGSKWRWPVAIIGGFALLLSLVRTAWIGLLIGFLLICFWDKAKRLHLIIALAVSTTVLVPIATLPQFQDVLTSRLNTFDDLQSDGSLSERKELYQQLFPFLLEHPLGAGLSNPTHTGFKGKPLDTGLLRVPLMFGWAGAVLVYAAFGLLLMRSFKSKVFDETTLIYRAIFIVMLILLLSGDTMTGVEGFLLWTACSICVVPEEAVSESRMIERHLPLRGSLA